MPMQEEGGVYLFVSVDMVNSTEFKSRERNWPFVLHHFYESVVGESACARASMSGNT